MTEVVQLRTALNRRDALFRDPHVTGDLLLVGLLWDHLIEAKAMAITGEDAQRVLGWRPGRYRSTCLDDVPTYEPPSRPRKCPHVGPRGGRCWASVALWRSLPDVDDGTVTWVGSCLPHHYIVDAALSAYRTACGVRVAPKPAYNTRSKLAHHFPEIDWPVWWEKLTQGRRYPEPYDVARDPERGGSVVIQPPKLRVVMAP